MVAGRTKIQINVPSIKQKIAKQIKQDFDKISNDIIQDLGNFFDQQLEQSKVVQSLRGVGAGSAFDLQAEFGLLPGESDQAIEDIKFIFFDHLKLSPLKLTGGKGTKIATINLTGLKKGYEAQVKRLPSGVSFRPKSGEVIPWLEWMMTGDTDVSPEVGIAFDLNQRLTEVSRTGRALMLEETHRLVERFPYKLPRGWQGGAGEQFIDSIVKRASFQKRIQSIILKFVRKLKV